MPEPFGPMIAATSPDFTVRFRPRMISVPSSSMRTWRFLISSMLLFRLCGSPIRLVPFIRRSQSWACRGSSKSLKFQVLCSVGYICVVHFVDPFPQIHPGWIQPFNQLNFPFTKIPFQRLFSLNCQNDIGMHFEPNQIFGLVFRREPSCSRLACVSQIASHADHARSDSRSLHIAPPRLVRASCRHTAQVSFVSSAIRSSWTSPMMTPANWRLLDLPLPCRPAPVSASPLPAGG